MIFKDVHTYTERDKESFETPFQTPKFITNSSLINMFKFGLDNVLFNFSNFNVGLTEKRVTRKSYLAGHWCSI